MSVREGLEFETSLESDSTNLNHSIVKLLDFFGPAIHLLATGAGAEARQPIGIVVVFGVTVSAALTLFVVPAVYRILARRTQSPEAVTRRIEDLRASTGTRSATPVGHTS